MNCHYCQQDMSNLPKSAYNKPRKFCDLSCYGRHLRSISNNNPTMIECIECAESFKKCGPKKFCNRSCAAKYNNSKYPKRTKNLIPSRLCPICNELYKVYKGKENNISCSVKCDSERKRLEKIEKWLSGDFSSLPKSFKIKNAIRDYLLNEAGYKCELCQWSGINPASELTTLQIDHIDGDWGNPSRENLRVLCPNCHSLQPTHGALNVGNNSISWKERLNK